MKRKTETESFSLIGNGLDAIIQHDVAGMPAEITAAMRRQRYEVARFYYSKIRSRRGMEIDELRMQLGRNYQACWMSGRTPDLRCLPAHTRDITEKLACLR